MSDISSLENRITAALDRIRVGLDRQPAADPAAADAMQSVLERERATNAELTERLGIVKERRHLHGPNAVAPPSRACGERDRIGSDLGDVIRV